MTEPMTEPEPTESSAPPEHHESAVAALRSFVGDHPGEATAVINYLGRRGARIVVVAADGAFGDAVVPSVEAAADVCERAGIPVGEWDRELTARITPLPADRLKMRGTGR